MEILIVVLIALAFLALALIPRFIAIRERRRGAPTLPAPTEPDRAEADGAVEAGPPVLRDRLGRTRAGFGNFVRSLRGGTSIDQQTWDDLEEALITADVGVATAGSLLADLQEQVAAEEWTEPDQLLGGLRVALRARLDGDRTLKRAATGRTVWLFVGVNGVGKTTTIGKLAQRAATDGESVVLAGGDTFRAAAMEQLGVWAERTGADVVLGQEGGDPGSVIYDAVQRAESRGADLVLADTAGRLHNKANLMEELQKVRRVADRDPGSVAEVILVLDATTGQNGLTQAQQFTEAVDVTGVVLTKLDGSAKGGIVVAIEDGLGIPVKLVGLGEGADDLVAFDPDAFVDALLDES